MKKNEVMLLVILLSFFNNGLSQLVTPDEKVTGLILFADSIKTEEDFYINRITRGISPRNQNNTELSLQYYNLAICYSAKSQIDSACYFLRQVLDHSSEYNNLVYTDTDFESLRRAPCWNTIAQKIDSAFLAHFPDITHEKLAMELYHIYLMDQHARGFGLKKIDKSIVNIDYDNLNHVQDIIMRHGWPTYSMVGETAAEGAFLVIQHSEVEVQQIYFMQLFNAAQNNEAKKEWVALLLDRISIQKKGFQYFGTQVYQIKDSITGSLGKYNYFPIHDESIVDSLRMAFDMVPLNEYYSLFGIDYKPARK